MAIFYAYLNKLYIYGLVLSLFFYYIIALMALYKHGFASVETLGVLDVGVDPIRFLIRQSWVPPEGLPVLLTYQIYLRGVVCSVGSVLGSVDDS